MTPESKQHVVQQLQSLREYAKIHEGEPFVLPPALKSFTYKTSFGIYTIGFEQESYALIENGRIYPVSIKAVQISHPDYPHTNLRSMSRDKAALSKTIKKEKNMQVVISPALSAAPKPDAATKSLKKTVKKEKTQLNKKKAAPLTPDAKYKKYTFSWRRVHKKVLMSKNKATREKWHKMLAFVCKYLSTKIAKPKLSDDLKKWYTTELSLYGREMKELAKATPSPSAEKLANLRIRRPKHFKVDNSKVVPKTTRQKLDVDKTPKKASTTDKKNEPVKKSPVKRTVFKLPTLKDASEKMKPLVRKYRDTKKAIAALPEKLTVAQKRKKATLEEELKKVAASIKRRARAEGLVPKAETKPAAVKDKAGAGKPVKVNMNEEGSKGKKTVKDDTGGRSPEQRETYSRTPHYRHLRDKALKAARNKSIHEGDRVLSKYDNKTLAKVMDFMHNKVTNPHGKKMGANSNTEPFEKMGIKKEDAPKVFDALKYHTSAVQNGKHE